MAKKKQKVFAVFVKGYQSGEAFERVKAASLYDVLKEYFSWDEDWGPDNEPSAAHKRDLLKEWETGNGDGRDCVYVLDVATGEVVFGANVLEEGSL